MHAPDSHRPAADIAPGNTLRVMTYNVHSCIGPDRHLSVERIARAIAGFFPDVVALQELGEARGNLDGKTQARAIARLLDMDCHFFPVIDNDAGTYGIALLSHLPMRVVRAAILPQSSPNPALEPRGALWATVMLDGLEVQVLNTHFGLPGKARLHQAEALLGDNWLAHSGRSGPTVLCGDFNSLPLSRVCRLIRKTLDDVQRKKAKHRPRATFHSWLPLARIDHVYVDAATRVNAIHIPRSPLTRSASDHLPLIADLDFSAHRQACSLSRQAPAT